MKLLDVPHYSQVDSIDCQAACAAMVLDYWDDRKDGGSAERIARLLEEFSFGFRPQTGHLPPAITGLVALVVARKGFSVDFYSKNPDGGGFEGLKFLKNQTYGFADDDVTAYAKLASSITTGGASKNLTVHTSGMTEYDIEHAINAGKPVVVIVDVKILKRDYPRHDNHAVVITGSDDTFVAIRDPADREAHRTYDRATFFEAHRNTKTDCDAYVISGSGWYRRFRLFLR